MARSLFAAARLAASLASENAAAARRSFSAAAAANKADEKVSAVASRTKKTKPVDGLVDSPAMSWVPDPVTGYYRPGNRAAELDPADLRQRLLSHNGKRPALQH